MDSPQMNAEERRYKHAELTEVIIGVFMRFITNSGLVFSKRSTKKQWRSC
jgi:hypothetical protein